MKIAYESSKSTQCCNTLRYIVFDSNAKHQNNDALFSAEIYQYDRWIVWFMQLNHSIAQIQQYLIKYIEGNAKSTNIFKNNNNQWTIGA